MIILKTAILFFLSHLVYSSRRSVSCPAEQKEEWSYNGKNGPEYWGERFRDCYGSRQSPIAISDKTVTQYTYMGPLRLKNYDVPVTRFVLENTGESIVVRIEDGVNRTLTVRGQTFILLQFHFHWGKSRRGSEHMINKQKYDMEAHFVHSNGDSGAVIAVLFNTNQKNNKALATIVDNIKKVKYRNDTVWLKGQLRLDKMLPYDVVNYYRYVGSLTTPNCREDILWTVLKSIEKIGYKQVNEFKSVYTTLESESSEGCHLTENVRPLQDGSHRKVMRNKG